MNNARKWECKSSLEESLGRVGIKFEEESISIYFPLGYDIPSDNEKNLQRKSVIDLLTTMSLSKLKDDGTEHKNQEGDSADFPMDIE